jgi:hypothetical protein
VPTTGNVVVTNPDTQTATLPAAFTYAVRGDASRNGALTGADTFFLNRPSSGRRSPTLCNGDANGTARADRSRRVLPQPVRVPGRTAPPP